MIKQFPFIFLVLLAGLSCLAMAEPQPTPTADAATGIEGVISVGPIHGGPARIGVPDSRPLVNTEFVIENEKGIAAAFTTDDQGHFRVALPPGHYTVSRKEKKGGIGHYGPFEVEVVAGQIAKVDWHCDTGMR